MTSLLLRNCGRVSEPFALLARGTARAAQHGDTPGDMGNVLSISPSSIASLIAFGLLPSTWQPTLKAVPRISLTHPFRSLEKDLNFIVLAISMISSRETDLLCLMFFSFFRSRGGSLSARMMSEDAVGTTETAAWRFWMVSLTVTRRPFCNTRRARSHAVRNRVPLSNSRGRAGRCSYPVTSGLRNVLTDLLGGQTKRTDLGGKSRGGTDLTTGRPEVAVSSVVVSSRLLPLLFLSGERVRIAGGRGRGGTGEACCSYMILISLGSILGAAQCAN